MRHTPPYQNKIYLSVDWKLTPENAVFRGYVWHMDTMYDHYFPCESEEMERWCISPAYRRRTTASPLQAPLLHDRGLSRVKVIGASQIALRSSRA